MTILFMKKKYQLERFFVTWLMILFMILTDAFTAFAQVKQATVLVNGISCDLEQGILKVEFVTPDVVRVQYTGKIRLWEMERMFVCHVQLIILFVGYIPQIQIVIY